jgi:acetyl-CoA C-acetyltransferase
MAQGIKDKVAILGVGCSKFGERWDASTEDLMVEAFTEATGRRRRRARAIGRGVVLDPHGRRGQPAAAARH